MVQPKTPPLSLRIPPDVMADVDRWAERHKCTRHAALLRLVGIGLGGDAGMMRAYLQERAAAPRIPAGRIPSAAGFPSYLLAENKKPSPVKIAEKFRGVTASGETLPERGAYQKKGKKP